MLTCGDIVYIKVQLQYMDEPKPKILVYICNDNNPVFLKINSNSHKFCNEVLLRKSIYSFLLHDSYLDCSFVINNAISTEQLDHILNYDKNVVKGKLTFEDLKQASIIINQVRTISPINRRLINTAITGLLKPYNSN